MLESEYTKEFILSHVSTMKLSYNTKIKASERILIMGSKDCYKVFSLFWDDDIDLQESFFIMCLNRSNKVIGVKCISKGGMTATIVDLKILFSYAILSGASSIILAHNHPSGSLLPSDSDNQLTYKIKESGKLLDIMVLDHLIINSEEKFFSYADEGKM